MDYVISNQEKVIFIRIGKNGKPETCSRNEAQQFTFEKAKNVISNMPKVLKKFNFTVMEDARPHIEKKIEVKEETAPKIITSPDYEVSPSVKKWIEKVKVCDNLVKEAKERNTKLRTELSNMDKELSNLLHSIEIEKWKNGCDGYKCYKESKLILEKRRKVKDEMLVTHAILETNLSKISEEWMIKIVDGLQNRKFQYREID